MSIRKKMTETDLANIIIDYYKNLGYEVYQEVHNTVNGSNRADIVAVKDGKYTVIETKMNFGLTIVYQAFAWKMYSHFSFICIPSAKKGNSSSRRFGYDICRDYGIGVIEYTTKGDIRFVRDSTLNPEPILPQLYEKQKEQIAGGKNSDYITPFKITCSLVREYLEENGNKCTLNSIMENINHHYSNNHSAKSSILKMVKMGVLKDIRYIKEKRVNYLYIQE